MRFLCEASMLRFMWDWLSTEPIYREDIFCLTARESGSFLGESSIERRLVGMTLG